MANPATAGTSNTGIQINYGLASQSNAGNGTSWIDWNLQIVQLRPYTESSSWYNWSFNQDGSGSGGWFYNYNQPVIASGQYAVGHDANGDCYTYMSGSLSWYGGSGTADVGYTPPKIYRAPSWAASSADSITSDSVRLGNEISSFGIGTACAMRMYYKKASDASWTATADQADVGGYNYWTVVALEPGTVYDYFARIWNNNGGVTDGTHYQFTTTSSWLIDTVGDF